MDKNLDPDFNFRVWTIFHQAAESSIKVVENELFREHGISYIQLAVMYVVKNSKNKLSPTEISRILLREPHTTAALINRMEKQGIVKKTKDSKMKNIKRVSLTRKGEELYVKAMAVESPFQLLSGLSTEEKEAFLTSTEKIRNAAVDQLTVRRIWEPLFG